MAEPVEMPFGLWVEGSMCYMEAYWQPPDECDLTIRVWRQQDLMSN